MDAQKGSILSRRSKVTRTDFAPVPVPRELLSLFPPTLAAAHLAELCHRLALAKLERQPLIWMGGAHVIKVGLNPVLIELMRQGWITLLAVNGAAIVHDVELALFGHTSENVEGALAAGTFGQTEESNAWINRAINEGDMLGLGRAVGAALDQPDVPYRETSLFATAWQLGIPLTVHVAIGTDVFQTHPSANGGVIGDLSLKDYHTFVTHLGRIQEGRGGGALLNWGSAVLLPEIALKAFSELRARDVSFEGLAAANFDMIQSYRGRTQIVERVKALGGWAAAITGHHEIMLPLVAAQLLAFDRRLENPE